MASRDRRAISFEFFPPRGEEGREKLMEVAKKLQQCQPEYVSVTFGAGGSTQQGTLETVLDLMRSGFAVAPHLSCIGSTRSSITALLDQYRQAGVQRIVALRGDMPSGMRDAGDLHYANELVAFIRQHSGDYFHIEVAAYPEFHPQATSATADLDNFARKVAAGANSAITQYFYNVDAYSRFIEAIAARGVTLPVIPGVMPITNLTNLARFSAMCGAEIPRWLRLRLEAFGGDAEGLREFGLEVTAKLCQQLLQAGAPGLHFYTMNQSAATLRLWQSL
ncbi:MAG: methylenetetrahydrofolate reductase [NAD(P)H] [Gammaproteobacteria bacterium]|nr:methylenetetrahydrofolate reductase [NAD(P)H] [Gammaproteobacteria bacterium]